MITWRRKKDGHVGLCHLRLDTGEGWRGGSGGGGTWLPGTELAAPPTLAITTERLPLLTTAPSALKANAVRPLCPRLLGDEPLSRPALLAGPEVRVSRVQLRWRLAHSTVPLTTVASALGHARPASLPGC